MDTHVIYKYPIEIKPRQVIQLPRIAKILHVAMQHGRPTIWAEVDPAERLVERTVSVIGTGHPFEVGIASPADLHIGTVFDGPLVWHVYISTSYQ